MKEGINHAWYQILREEPLTSNSASNIETSHSFLQLQSLSNDKMKITKSLFEKSAINSSVKEVGKLKSLKKRHKRYEKYSLSIVFRWCEMEVSIEILIDYSRHDRIVMRCNCQMIS